MPRDVRRAIRLDVVLPHTAAVVGLYDRPEPQADGPDPAKLGGRNCRREIRELDDLEEK